MSALNFWNKPIVCAILSLLGAAGSVSSQEAGALAKSRPTLGPEFVCGGGFTGTFFKFEFAEGSADLKPEDQQSISCFAKSVREAQEANPLLSIKIGVNGYKDASENENGSPNVGSNLWSAYWKSKDIPR